MHKQILATAAFVFLASIAACPSAYALIHGGEGNKPLNLPGLPQGAAAIFNHQARIAWWEGPGLGDGEWHAECRGDAQVFNEVLQLFSKLAVENKRIVVHDGVGYSSWLPRNRGEIDWMFTVWNPKSWEEYNNRPRPRKRVVAKGPPSMIDVYIGGNIKWADVKIPKGLEVDDRRLESHGFTLADRVVLEGKVIDLDTNQPLAAHVFLAKYERNPDGGKYVREKEVLADAEGQWVLKNVPTGSYDLIIEADGYVPRLIGFEEFGDQPGWARYDSGLARPGPLSGRVTDLKGNPLADATVRLGEVVTTSGTYYSTPNGNEATTDADGRFQFDQVPIGSVSIDVHKPGYCRLGLGKLVNTPARDVVLQMPKSASLTVSIDFTNAQRPGEYLVKVEAEGGPMVGKWGGSGQINEQNQISFSDIPPGRYVIYGHPNPGADNQQTESITVDLKGGQNKEISIQAK